ncbi:MAG: VOC family protein [Myxococcales bacterium]|nr:VOC family protein [Myxococcales bacterium]
MEGVALWRMTLAVNDLDTMAAFYDDVFGCRFEAFPAFGTILYRGRMGGIVLVLCPNSLARIHAEQSRHQLHLVVDNVSDFADRAEECGGRAELYTRAGGELVAVITDPEGNSIELMRG